MGMGLILDPGDREKRPCKVPKSHELAEMDLCILIPEEEYISRDIFSSERHFFFQKTHFLYKLHFGMGLLTHSHGASQ